MPLVQKNGSGSPIAIYWVGDSRLRGFGTTDPTTKNWLAQLGLRLPPYYQITNAGVDGLRLFDTSGDATKVANTTAAAVTAIGSSTRSVIGIQLDINDWSANFSAATYGTELAAQLDSFHAASPTSTCVVFASLDYSTYGTANTAPSTMQDYVTQQTNVVAARSSYAQLILGKPILTWVASPAPGPTQANGFVDVKHYNDIGGYIVGNSMAALVQGWVN